jgi:ppGpp synthetase/RelA/SpoT-type nucleotidyltranferase
MQDIVGGRIVVPTAALQERVATQLVDELTTLNNEVRTKDTREAGDRLGYRAVHVMIGSLAGRPAEIQVRTALQQHWAQTVEDLDQSLGTDLKHGNGPTDWLAWLREFSDALRAHDLGDEVELPSRPDDRR